MKSPTSIRALFSFRGFVAHSALKGVLGDRYARIIVLRRRKKRRRARSVRIDVEVATTRGPAARGKRGTLFLIDYELLGQAANGIEIIENLGISRSSILVTSRFEEPGVLAKCESLELRLLPKSLAGQVPLCQQFVDCVLIDNDPIVHISWEMAAAGSGRRIAVFDSIDGFLPALGRISKDIPIYVDMDLGKGNSGYDVSKKLSDMGFRNLRLATGLTREIIPPMPWIKEVVGKNPPFYKIGN